MAVIMLPSYSGWAAAASSALVSSGVTPLLVREIAVSLAAQWSTLKWI